MKNIAGFLHDTLQDFGLLLFGPPGAKIGPHPNMIGRCRFTADENRSGLRHGDQLLPLGCGRADRNSTSEPEQKSTTLHRSSSFVNLTGYGFIFWLAVTFLVKHQNSHEANGFGTPVGRHPCSRRRWL
jgi:hypothetical protein